MGFVLVSMVLLSAIWVLRVSGRLRRRQALALLAVPGLLMVLGAVELFRP